MTILYQNIDVITLEMLFIAYKSTFVIPGSQENSFDITSLIACQIVVVFIN